MKYDVIYTPQFKKDIKHYNKKYKRTIYDIEPILIDLENGILLGEEVPEMGFASSEGAYKVRIVNSSAKVGKSNGFRLIYYAITEENEIYLLTIYSKKDKANITKPEIKKLINLYCK